jgi:hypothetical protein
MLNDAEERLTYYRRVIASAEADLVCPWVSPVPAPSPLSEGTCR